MTQSSSLAQHLLQLEGQAGWAARRLGSGQTLVHGSRRFLAASTIKLPVLALYAERRLQTAAAEDYRCDPRDWVEDSPLFETLQPGEAVSWDTLAAWMMVRSDNAATNLLIQQVGMRALQQWLQGQDLPETQLNRLMMDLDARARGVDNWTTPLEMLTLMERLVTGRLISPEATAWTLAILARCEDREKIPHLFPASVTIYNKPGELPGTRSDVGYLVSTQTRMVMALFTDGLTPDWDGPRVDDWLAELARLLWLELGGENLL